MFHEKNKASNFEKSVKSVKIDDYLQTFIFDPNERIRKNNQMKDQVEKISRSTRYKCC